MTESVKSEMHQDRRDGQARLWGTLMPLKKLGLYLTALEKPLESFKQGRDMCLRVTSLEVRKRR